ncbi:MAG: universal stress protein [Acidobacteria bacterium]|nr:universal stress protein [Acidobacteriota bacterium]
MFSVAKVLCPIDFSPVSGRALEAALSAVAAYGAELYLLYVAEGPVPAGGGSLDNARAEAGKEALRDRLAALVAEAAPDVTPHVLVSDGDAAEEILRMEEIFGIDLIVLAPHGRPTLGKIIFGSVSDKVSRGARSHLLVVQNRGDGESADAGVP